MGLPTALLLLSFIYSAFAHPKFLPLATSQARPIEYMTLEDNATAITTMPLYGSSTPLLRRLYKAPSAESCIGTDNDAKAEPCTCYSRDKDAGGGVDRATILQAVDEACGKLSQITFGLENRQVYTHSAVC